ncbi:putative dolichol-phosphate mannosyltransferase [Geobacter sp. OR-1]|uniref:glycosyltransferase n=1 Tax=Geobacter sp. OR-1 TaxID=1266765 RepID=UPI000541AC05|nr:glycosyltransferase [Geobacter sp. OR-1]GAM10544.1 putative dolichol-phosphate mannosyltransferase [Geobacter sp. OR-1]
MPVKDHPFSVSIIMPTYNEAGNIADLMRDAVEHLKKTGVTGIEVIVADDDSPDLTWKIAEETVCPGATVKVLRRLENHGLTASMNDAIAAAQNDVIVWFDCDFSQTPDRIPQLLEKIGEGFDVAVNSRYLPGGGENRCGDGSGLHLLLSRCLNYSLRHLLDPAFTDYTSGFIALRREVCREFRLRGDYGEYFIDFIYRVLLSKRFRVVELPYIMQQRRSGISKTGTNLLHYLKRGRKYIATIMALRRLRAGGAVENTDAHPAP